MTSSHYPYDIITTVSRIHTVGHRSIRRCSTARTSRRQSSGDEDGLSRNRNSFLVLCFSHRANEGLFGSGIMDQSASNSKGGPLGGMDLFSLFRIDSNLREKAEAKLEEAARKHTAELTEEYNARIDYLKSVRIPVTIVSRRSIPLCFAMLGLSACWALPRIRQCVALNCPPSLHLSRICSVARSLAASVSPTWLHWERCEGRGFAGLRCTEGSLASS